MPNFICLLLIAGAAFAAIDDISPSDVCGEALAEAGRIRVTHARALDIPAQLGFVIAAPFERTLARTRGLFLRALDGNSARPWTLTLNSIYPESMHTSVARFTALNTATARIMKHAPSPETRAVVVTFNVLTGDVISYAVTSLEAAPPPVVNVRVPARMVADEIERQTWELTTELQGGEYRYARNAERAAVHRRVEIGHRYTASNRSTMWIEVRLKALLETTTGGLNPRVFNLVYEISPNFHARLRAADDDDVKELIRRRREAPRLK